MEEEIKQSKGKFQPRVVAVIGSIAAGKDELVHYLIQQYGVLGIDVGRFARQLGKDGEEGEAHLLYDTSAKKLAEYGPEVVMRQVVVEMMENGSPPPKALVITGVRTPSEALSLKAYFGPDLLLTFVKVEDQTTRYDRTQKREFGTDPNDFQDFVQQDDQLKSDYALGKTAVLADITLWNNKSLAAYYQQIETHIVPHLLPEKNSESMHKK